MRSVLLLIAVACNGSSSAPGRERLSERSQTIRCAVIGGMTETGFWRELVAPYERLTGNKIELVATGPKPVVIKAFREGGIDLITVHAGDAMINLVVDGLAVDPQPWVQNDLVIMGPAADPAKVRGMRDAVRALEMIEAAKAPILVHASMGADGVLHDLSEAAQITLPAESTILFSGENQHEVLARAAAAGAYTLVGRIPVLLGKLKQPGMEIMVQADVRLRRPYLVEVASGPATDPRLAAARDFVRYLRQRETQQWIGTFGKGRYDDAPLFFPITVP